MRRFIPFITEKYAAGGFNYENEVGNRLKQHGLMSPAKKTAGSSADAPDAEMTVKGKTHALEVKAGHSAMMGQLELHHSDEKGWHVSPKSAKKYPATTDYIHKSGFLEKVNKHWGKPSGDYHTDLKMGNVHDTREGTEGIAAHYHEDRHTPYMQIKGKGLFHLKHDAADIGTSKLEGNTHLRARMKPRSTDPKTGKRKYGALIVMSLKKPNTSSIDLDKHTEQLAQRHE